jgi:hypothetical protein
MNEWIWTIGGMMLRVKSSVLKEKPVPLPPCPSHFPHGLTWGWTRPSIMRTLWLTGWTMVYTIRLWCQPLYPHKINCKNEVVYIFNPVMVNRMLACILKYNPYPANVENMVSSCHCYRWHMGFNLLFKGLICGQFVDVIFIC